VKAVLTFDEIKELINRVEQSSIQHFELEQKESKLVISKAAVHKNPVDTLAEEPQIIASPVALREQQFTEEVIDSREEALHTIVSPTVGTFYAAPEPGADPFVQVGTQIQGNTIVCVLEAMKLFNEVEAGVKGQVVELLVCDGDFIEYGQPLFLVKAEG
jgi:acetyl-CoA carboxylase biotin carboxyl carrier protein